MTAEGKSLADKNPEKYIPGRCALTITNCYSDDERQLHTQEMHRRIQTS